MFHAAAEQTRGSRSGKVLYMRRTGLGPALQASRLPRRPKRRLLHAEQLLFSRRAGPTKHSNALLRGLIAGFVVIVAAGAGISGYYLGSNKDAARISETTAAAGAAYYSSTVSIDEALSQRIEKINVQEQVNEQSKVIEQQRNELDNVNKNILDALMRNLNTKLSASRSSTGYKSYIAQAKILVALNNKVVKFKKTDSAKTIDISAYSSEINSRLSHLPTLRPIPGDYSGYGWRIHPIFHYRQFHAANDIGARTGTSIKAAGAGTVTYAAYNRGGGYMITINHGNGFTTTYMHCSVLKVKNGQRVSKGQIIGKVGNTGYSTTPHLHFEVHYRGTPFNPREILLQW
jgi:murein DD-endopeptidase MepM/ murein hydrolase activator NlpD